MVEDIEVLEEYELDGFSNYILKIPKEIHEQLVNIYGTEDYEDQFSKDFNEFLREEIKNKEA